MRDRVIGKVTIYLEHEFIGAKPHEDGVVLILSSDGEKRELYADHVICGTGYKPQLSRLPFLDGELLSHIKAVDGTPVLSGNFESSLPGLYFVGAIAANTFGPVLRFACGAEFAAPRLARHIARYKRVARPALTERGPEVRVQSAGPPQLLVLAGELSGLGNP